MKTYDYNTIEELGVGREMDELIERLIFHKKIQPPCDDIKRDAVPLYSTDDSTVPLLIERMIQLGFEVQFSMVATTLITCIIRRGARSVATHSVKLAPALARGALTAVMRL